MRRLAPSALQASVPRDTQLVITVQRASNLPHRIAAGGGGVRAQSPNRMAGAAGCGTANSMSPYNDACPFYQPGHAMTAAVTGDLE